jgi:hypothetical protein
MMVGIMTSSDLALEIAERVILLDTQVEASKKIAERYAGLSREQLDKEVQAIVDRVLNGKAYLLRVAELTRVFEAHSDPTKLIQRLRDQILNLASPSASEEDVP